MTARPDPAADRSRGRLGGAVEVGASRLGWLLHMVVVAAGLWVLAVALLAALLGAVGWWHPAWALVAAVGVVPVTRWALDAVPTVPLARWTAVALAGITLASAAWLAATSAEQVLPRRDAGSNLQAAVWLEATHRRVVPVDAAALGGPGVLALDGVTLASPAFYQVGSAAEPAVQPQFVIGPAAVFSVARPFGLGAMAALAGLATALAVLAVGLLTSASVGPRWGPVGALGTALLFPLVHTGRATYSEPLAAVTLGAGLLALVLAGRARDGRQAARAALVAGLLVGGTVLVRIDGLRETILLVPVAAVALGLGLRWARSLVAGAAIATVVGSVIAGWLSYRYLGDINASLLPLVAGGVLGGAGAAAALAVGRRGRWPRWVRTSLRWHRLPDAAGLVVVLAGLFLAARPLWQVVRQSATDPGARVVAGMQARQGLPVDGGRTYAEHSVAWLAWWVGPVALVVALLALAVLTRRLAAGLQAERPSVPAWAGPLVVAAGSSLLTLWRPGITPDHPWADRRLVIALPFVVVLVVAAAAAVARERPIGRRLAGVDLASTPVRVGGSALVVAALLVPTGLATWPHRSERVERGSAGAVAAVCRALQPGDVVLAVDSRAANEWPQVVRGMCGRAALSTTGALRADPTALATTVGAVAERVRATGGRLVLLAADSGDVLTRLQAGGTRQVVDTTVLEDDRLLTRRPDHLVTVPITVWLGSPRP